MKKNKLVLILSSIFSLSFLWYVFNFTQDIRELEPNLIKNTDVIDVTDKISTKLFVSSEDLSSEWKNTDFVDQSWTSVEIPKHRIVTVPEFREGNFAYYRIHIPEEILEKFRGLRNQIEISLQYVWFKKYDVYINGHFYRSYSPTQPLESFINLPVDERSDNLIAIKGYIGKGDSGINHRGKILMGKETQLNELYTKSYKGSIVLSLVFILCKGAVLLIFTLIYLVVRVDRFFDKSIIFSLFVIMEDLITGGVLGITNFQIDIALYNVANIGTVIFLVLVLADFLKMKISRKTIFLLVLGLSVVSYAIALDVLFRSYLFNVDHFLKFWNCAMLVALAWAIPKSFKLDRILFVSLLLAFTLTFWSAFFSANVGNNLKAISSLIIFLTVAYQTFVQLRLQQDQLLEQEKDVAIGKTASILAHDVRRPLDQMNLILNRISSGEASEEFLKVAKQDVEFALTTVNNQISDIMNFNRKQGLTLQPISFYSVLSSSIKQISAIKKNVRLTYDYSFRSDHKVLGDESRLAGVMTNLISNAAEAIRDMGQKPDGKITFSTSETRGFFIFRIHNDGPKIPEEMLPEIFKPLTTFGKVSGTGLGLASVSKIIQDHGGSISVKNTEPVGVEFTLSLSLSEETDSYPFASFLKDSSAYGYEKITHAEEAKDKLLRIFLLDDDRFVYEYFQELIRKVEYEVELVHAADFEKARELVEAKRFDLYILDYDLGDSRSGYSFYEQHLSFLRDEVIIHSNRDIGSIPGLKIRHFNKPLQFDQLRELCHEVDRKRLKILLVDDSSIITLGWKMFHGKHNVQCVSTPDEALTYLEANSDAIDLCVLDYYFEGIEKTGLELANEIKERYPLMKIVISSSTNSQTSYQYLEKGVCEVRNLGLA